MTYANIWQHLIMVFKLKGHSTRKKVSFILFGAPIIPDMAVIDRAYNSITLNEIAYTSK